MKKRKIFTKDQDSVNDGDPSSNANSLPRFAPEANDPDRQPSPSRSSSPATCQSTLGEANTPSSPLRYIPPHLQPEVADSHGLPGGAYAGADSPSEAYAALSIGTTGSSDNMSISPDGESASRDDNESGVQKEGASSRAIAGDNTTAERAASPAKRTAADMEEDTNLHSKSHQSPPTANGADFPNLTAPPAYAELNGDQAAGYHAQASMTLDEQVERVKELANTSSIEKGEKGYLISQRWLCKILARAPSTAKETEYPKEALEGDIGPIDNVDLVNAGAFQGPSLCFRETNVPFVALKGNLDRTNHYEILPQEAWKSIVDWYGLRQGQIPIVRFAQDTAPDDATTSYIQYEVYPPVFTIRKMLSGPAQANSESDLSETAVQVVASRQDRFQTFLAHSKRAANIPIAHKVKIWRQLEPSQVSVDEPNSARSGILTPAASRSTSPSAFANVEPQKLIIESTMFSKLEEGIDIESIDARDETANENYNGKANLDLLGLINDQTLILEEQIRGVAGGEFASDGRKKMKKIDVLQTDANNRASQLSSGAVTRGRTRRDGRARGTIGLSNLGNTCYMNSALQCISRIEELAVYFLDAKYKREINTDNPLGHYGKMAKAYGELLAAIYQENASSAFTPRAFKGQLSQAAPMFSGYGQQDSQEFLSFLVDALHEDLNRIHKKPYIENPDSDDSRVHDPDYIRELGETYRANHRLRNDSIAMDLFNGFYKNTMVCPDCDKVSVTFDPYSLLTLQLPIENTWHHELTFVPLLGDPSLHTLDIDKNSTVKSMKQSFAKKFEGLAPDRLFCAETFSHKFFKVWKDSESVSGITDNDVISLFELPAAPTNPGVVKKGDQYRGYTSQRDDTPDMDDAQAERMAVTVTNRYQGNDGRWTTAYTPFVVLITREEAKDFDAILRKLLAGVTHLTSRKFLREELGEAQPLSSRTKPDSESDSAAGSEDNSGSNTTVSDRSMPSEDGYVNVSVLPASTDASDAVELDDPTGVFSVLDSQTFLTPSLRSMFDIKYFKSATGDLHATNESNAHAGALLMQDRVRQPSSRRSSYASVRSTQSGHSGLSSSARSRTSSVSSDVDINSQPPDVLLGRPDSHFSGDVQSDPENDLPPVSMVAGFGKNRKRDRKHGRKQVTYSRKNNRNAGYTKRFNASRSSAEPEDNPYYIKLGEGILLDWNERAWDELFGGDPREPNDGRGYETLNLNFINMAKDPELNARLEKRTRRKKAGVSLDDCFAETARTETLSEENAWYCNRCKELRRADKTLEIWTLPDILVVHLKRFSGERYRRDKVDVTVDFPVEGLDLTNRVGMNEGGKECIYDLFAVDNHYGGLGGGHYTAMAKNFFDGKWYDFNGKSLLTVKWLLRSR